MGWNDQMEEVLKQTQKPREIEPYSKRWEQLANQQARSYCPSIKPCRECQHPVIDGYCCNYCGSSSP